MTTLIINFSPQNFAGIESILFLKAHKWINHLRLLYSDCLEKSYQFSRQFCNSSLVLFRKLGFFVYNNHVVNTDCGESICNQFPVMHLHDAATTAAAATATCCCCARASCRYWLKSCWMYHWSIFSLVLSLTSRSFRSLELRLQNAREA